MSLALSLKLTNLGNNFLRIILTVKMFSILRLSTKFLAVLRLSVNPTEAL